MQVLTWNINRQNKRLGRVMRAIEGAEADIICLQEVPEKLLGQLKELEGYTLHVCDEYKRLTTGAVSYMAILSRLPVVETGIVSHAEDAYASFRHRLHKIEEAIESMFIDINLDGTLYRIFNTHLPLMVPPRVRMKHFERILEELCDDAKNIICGDFNPVGKPFFNLLWGWLFSYNLTDYLVYEPLMVKNRIKKYGLKHAIRGCTHPITRQQLDYILAPHDLEVARKQHLKRYHSDHKPVLVEFIRDTKKA